MSQQGYGQGYDPNGYPNGPSYGQGPAYGQEQNREPDGYISHDPYAPQQTGYQQPYGQPYPYPAPGTGYGPGFRAYAYDAAHPPRPSVNFPTAIRLMFKNYANFYGRASRSEYWWVELAMFLVTVVFLVGWVAVLGAAESLIGSEADGLVVVMMLVTFVGVLTLGVPLLALRVRRLHDAGFSGFMTLIGMVPYVGWMVPLVMCCMDSKPEGIRYDHPDGSQPAVG